MIAQVGVRDDAHSARDELRNARFEELGTMP
jgi:hypothetical protein